MEKELQDLNNYFELINLTKFCEKYDFSYPYLRQVLKGKFPLTKTFTDKILVAISDFQRDQLELKKLFRFNFES